MGCANPAKTVHHPHLQFPHLQHSRLFWEWVSLVQVEAWPGWFWAPAARVQSTLCRFCSCGLNARKSWALHLHQSWSPLWGREGQIIIKKKGSFSWLQIFQHRQSFINRKNALRENTYRKHLKNTLRKKVHVHNVQLSISTRVGEVTWLRREKETEERIFIWERTEGAWTRGVLRGPRRHFKKEHFKKEHFKVAHWRGTVTVS